MATISHMNPSVLLVPNITVTGGVSYNRKVLEENQFGEKGERKRTESEKTVYDKEERDNGMSVQNRMLGLLKRELGAVRGQNYMIFPVDNRDNYEAVEDQVRFEVDAFNATAKYTRISFKPILVDVGGEDTRAMQAVADNLAQNLRELEQAMTSFNVKEIRNVVARLKGFDNLLPDGRGAHIKNLIETVRNQATEFKRTAKKLDEATAVEQNIIDSSVIDMARIAVFDDACQNDDYEPASVPITVDAARMDVEYQTPEQEFDAVEDDPTREDIGSEAYDTDMLTEDQGEDEYEDHDEPEPAIEIPAPCAAPDVPVAVIAKSAGLTLNCGGLGALL